MHWHRTCQPLPADTCAGTWPISSWSFPRQWYDLTRDICIWPWCYMYWLGKIFLLWPFQAPPPPRRSAPASHHLGYIQEDHQAYIRLFTAGIRIKAISTSTDIRYSTSDEPADIDEYCPSFTHNTNKLLNSLSKLSFRVLIKALQVFSLLTDFKRPWKSIERMTAQKSWWWEDAHHNQSHAAHSPLIL